MSQQCIVYITDRNYAFPTFLSAIQARKFAQHDTDVLVLMSEKIEDFPDLKALLNEDGVLLIDSSEALSNSLAKLDDTYFQKAISKTAMGRLLLPEILPHQYQKIIYLDGDTQVWGSLQALEDCDVPKGQFLAAPDYLSIEQYLNGETLPRYFNSGILKFNRDGWIGQEAFDLYIDLTRKKTRMKFHDQEVLNRLGKDKLIYINSKWNFPKQYLHLLTPEMQQPAIVHFMANPKPWHGAYHPWTKNEYSSYQALKAKSPVLEKYYPKISSSRKLVYRYRSIKSSLFAKLDPNQQKRMADLLKKDFKL